MRGIQRRAHGWAWVATALALGQPPAAMAGEVHAIRDTSVVVGHGQLQEGVHVVLQDGRITAIGSEVDIPAGAEVLDGTGLVVEAGWIDACTARAYAPPGPAGEEEVDPAAVNAGETPDFSQGAWARTREANRKGIQPEVRSRDRLRFQDADLEDWRQAGFTAWLVAPSDGYLRGQSCLVDLSGDPARRAFVAEPGWLHASAAGGRRGGRGGGYPGTLMAVLAHLRQTFHDAEHLRRWQEQFQQSPRSVGRPPDDSALEALWPALDGSLTVAFHADSENDILRALDLAREFGLRPVIVGAAEGYRVVDRLVQERVPVVASLDLPDKPERQGAKKARRKEEQEPAEGAAPEQPGDATGEEEWSVEDPLTVEPLKVFEDRVRRWEEQVTNVAVLLDAGVTVALSTLGHDRPQDFHKDLAVAVEHGLDPAAAQAALTTTPARLLGVDHLRGTVEVGKTADLLVVQGPRAGEGREVRWVFLGGRRFEGVKAKEEAAAAAEGETATDPGTADLAGRWQMEGEDDRMDSILALTQEGTTLSGTLKSEMGEWPVTKGSVKGQEFELLVTVEFQSDQFDFRLAGRLEEGILSGSMETPFGEPFPFQARRIDDRQEEGR